MPARAPERVSEFHTEVVVAGKGSARAIRRARSQLLRWRPDIVHAQDRRSGLICAGLDRGWPRSARPRAVLHTYHGVPDDVTEPWFRGEPGEGPSRYSRAVLAADALLARAVTRTVVPAESMGQFLRRRLLVPPARIVHIDNGLPLPPSSPPTGAIRRLLFVGLLVRRKGVHLLLEAMAAAALPRDVTLAIAGDGPERANLEALSSRLGLAERVDFLGFRADVPALLADCQAFILPSEMEQQPLVLIEAMGAGKVIVATDVGGVRDMMGDAGHVVPPGDPGRLARVLEEVTTHTDAAHMGVAAAERARDRFAVEHARDRHVALYSGLILPPPGERR